MLRGGEELLDDLCGRWKIQPGETTADGRITLEFAECLGVCEGAPCVLIQDERHACVTAEEVERIVNAAPNAAPGSGVSP